ncbi:ankyrin repeat domain-containing protein SOWAHC isoform X3, partial [Lates japonicus]
MGVWLQAESDQTKAFTKQTSSQQQRGAADWQEETCLIFSVSHRVQLILEKDWVEEPSSGEHGQRPAAQPGAQPRAGRSFLFRRDGSLRGPRALRTALHWAAKQGRQEVVDMMLCSGADVNARSQLGMALISGTGSFWSSTSMPGNRGGLALMLSQALQFTVDTRILQGSHTQSSLRDYQEGGCSLLGRLHSVFNKPDCQSGQPDSSVTLPLLLSRSTQSGSDQPAGFSASVFVSYDRWISGLTLLGPRGICSSGSTQEPVNNHSLTLFIVGPLMNRGWSGLESGEFEQFKFLLLALDLTNTSLNTVYRSGPHRDQVHTEIRSTEIRSRDQVHTESGPDQVTQRSGPHRVRSEIRSTHEISPHRDQVHRDQVTQDQVHTEIRSTQVRSTRDQVHTDQVHRDEVHTEIRSTQVRSTVKSTGGVHTEIRFLGIRSTEIRSHTVKSHTEDSGPQRSSPTQVRSTRSGPQNQVTHRISPTESGPHRDQVHRDQVHRDQVHTEFRSTQVRSTQVRSTQRSGPHRSGPHRSGPQRSGPQRSGPTEIRSTQGSGPQRSGPHRDQVHTDQVHTDQVHTEIRSTQRSSPHTEIRSTQVRSTEIRSHRDQVHRDQVHTEVRSTQIRSTEIRSTQGRVPHRDQVHTGRRSTEIRSTEVRLHRDQVHRDQVHTGQVHRDQVHTEIRSTH